MCSASTGRNEVTSFHRACTLAANSRFAFALHSPFAMCNAYFESPRMVTAFVLPSMSSHRSVWAIADNSPVLLLPTSAPRNPSSSEDVMTEPLNSSTTSPSPLPNPESPRTTTTPQPAGVSAVTLRFSWHEPSKYSVSRSASGIDPSMLVLQ